MMARHIQLLDLKDEVLAAEYEAWHRPGRVPAAVPADIAAGIVGMEIYQLGKRLAMILQTQGDGDPNARIGPVASRDWEMRMNRYQEPLAGPLPGAKWQPARLIFDLNDHKIQG